MVAAEQAVASRVPSVAGRAYSLVKSDVGLITILLAYSFLGAVVLHHAEYDSELRLRRQLAQHKRRCVDSIVNMSATALSQSRYDNSRANENLSRAVEKLVDDYVARKEHLRPLSNAPEWTYWGALFFCGTVYTTVGSYSSHYTVYTVSF